MIRLTATVGGESRQWVLEQSPTRVGRSSANPIQLLDGSVSREHAEFVLAGERWTVRDLGSRNGTRVNGVNATAPLPIRNGDAIEIGHVVVTAESPDDQRTLFTTSKSIDSSIKVRVADLLLKPSSESADPNRLMHLLAEAGQMLVLPRPMQETCEAILRFVEKAVRGSRFVVLLRERDGAELKQLAARYRGGSAHEPLALSNSITRLVLDENTSVITSDAANDPRFMGQHSIIAQAIHSAMAVPLFDNEHVLGILYVDSTSPAVIYDQNDLELLSLLANMAAVKITNARLLDAEQSRMRMQQELATATRIQQNLLPDAPSLPGWSCHARIEACHEVGGDLFDFYVREDGRVVVLVGDVSGKGMGAALLMSSALSSARVLYDACEDPLALVRRLNGALQRTMDGRSFVTLFAGYLEPATGRLSYVNAGHPEPHLVKSGRVRTLPATGIPVGMLPDFPWQLGEATLEAGELAAIFSDGIPEAQRGEEFFELERFADAMKQVADEPNVDRIADQLVAAVDAFSAGEHRSDDLTLVLLRRN